MNRASCRGASMGRSDYVTLHVDFLETSSRCVEARDGDRCYLTPATTRTTPPDAELNLSNAAEAVKFINPCAWMRGPNPS